MARIISVGKHFVEIGLDDGSIINVEKQKLDFTFKKGDTVEIYGEKDNPTIMPKEYIKRESIPFQVFKSILLLLLISSIVIAAILIGKGINTISKAFDGSNESGNNNSIQETAPVNIGDSLVLDSVSYTVTDVSTTDTVGNKYFSESAKGIYVVVYIRVINQGKKSITLYSSQFNIIYDDKTYESNSIASGYLSMDNDNESIWFSELNPGLTLNGVIVFDVSDDVVTSGEMQLLIESDFIGSETGIVNLTK